jgi:hypothetical protein
MGMVARAKSERGERGLAMGNMAGMALPWLVLAFL